MGLDCSHDAFCGAYSAFNRFRQAVCSTLGEGASFPPHETPNLDNTQIYHPANLKTDHPGLWEFLTHSDCEGEINPEMCVKVADDLETVVLPKLLADEPESFGHIKQRGGYVKVLQLFIAGCREAAEANEPLEFL